MCFGQIQQFPSLQLFSIPLTLFSSNTVCSTFWKTLYVNLLIICALVHGYIIRYPSEFDGKTPMWKTPIFESECGEIKVESTWKLHSDWLAFIMLEGSMHMNRGEIYSTVLHYESCELQWFKICSWYSNNTNVLRVIDWVDTMVYKIKLRLGTFNWTQNSFCPCYRPREPKRIILLYQRGNKLNLKFLPLCPSR